MTVAGDFVTMSASSLTEIVAHISEQMKKNYMLPIRVLVFKGDKLKCLTGGTKLNPIVVVQDAATGESISTLDAVKNNLVETEDGLLFTYDEKVATQDSQKDDGASAFEDFFGGA
jgi:hypothetical protein